MAIIEVDNVTKRFRARRGTRILLGRGGIGDWFRGSQPGTVTALQDISFTVDQGESLGIIGANGSGKSTLLKLIGGVTVPTEGEVRVQGRVASLLELGAGFHPMLTGRENVYLNACILGMRHWQVDEVFDEIVAFSGIGDFIDYPVDTYSSGMYVRIGFAVAAYTNPDIFLIDEVLSVGDEEFQRRCRRRIGELMEMGKTVVFVSHDLGIVNTLCQRVILLSQGKMILRESTNKAISFYLRQIGAENTLHTLTDAPLEAIKCNGRISLFFNQEELTSASGLQFQIFSLGYWHNALDADWDIVERSDTSCVARGTIAKLSLTIIWTLRLEGGELVWKLALECEKPLNEATFETNLFFPTLYTRWTYDDANGTFPELRPEDTDYLKSTAPELLCETAALLPDPESDEPAVVLKFEGHRPHFRGFWSNTDYMTGCRIFRAEEHVADQASALGVGTHELLTVRVRPTQDRTALESMLGERSQRQTLMIGDLSCRFDRGRIRLAYRGQQISDVFHIYASMFIKNLWHDSHNLRWDAFEQTENGLRFEGVSRRAPLRMIWEMEADGGALALTIWIDAAEPVDMQEYHASVILKEPYREWKTSSESGTFPAFTPDMSDWLHLNEGYPHGTFAEAVADSLPVVRFDALEGAVEPRMTPLRTGHQERGRVLQALFAPEHGAIHFEPGRQLYFKGRISVTDAD